MTNTIQTIRERETWIHGNDQLDAIRCDLCGNALRPVDSGSTCLPCIRTNGLQDDLDRHDKLVARYARFHARHTSGQNQLTFHGNALEV